MGVIQGNINQALAIGSALLSQTPMAEQQRSIAEDKAKQNIAFNKAQNKISAYENDLNRISELEKIGTDKMTEEQTREYLGLLDKVPNTNIDKLYKDMYSTIEDDPKRVAKVATQSKQDELTHRADMLGVQNPEILAARKAYQNALNKANRVRRQKRTTKAIRDNLKKENEKNDTLARKDIIRKV